MSNFEERMEARKLKEAQEKSEKQKEMGVQKYPCTFAVDILGTSQANAQETFDILYKILAGFDDLKNVVGVVHTPVEEG